MAITTYAQLQTAIGNWLARDDLTTRIPEFVELAEFRLYRKLQRISGTVQRDTTFAIATEYVTIPTGLTEVLELAIEDGSDPDAVLAQVPEYQIDEIYGGRDAKRPEVFAVVGEELRFGPAPNQSYNAKITYYKKPDVLSDSNTSNWFMANAPDALLYASLLESAPFLGDDARLATWGKLFDEAIEDLETQDRRLRYKAKRPRSRSEVRFLTNRRGFYDVNGDIT